MTDLDKPHLFREADPQDMLARISELPQQCRDAWANAQSLPLPAEYRQAKAVVILGMGGSAIGGDLLRTLLESECPVPLTVNRDYTVPAFVNGQTLVIASSYSGNTEETLAAFEAARQAEAMLLAITTDGKLATRARELNVPLLTFDYHATPRASLGHSIVALIGIVCRLGLVSDKAADLDEAIAVMESWQREINEAVPLAENAAKKLAAKLHDRLSVVYGAGHLSEVARRWKGQFNENAKAWAFFEQLPEMNHNALAGVEFPADLAKKIVAVMLTSSLDHPRTRVRFQITQEVLSQHGVSCDVVEGRGASRLAQMLSAIHFGDYVSFYLAMLYGKDPTSLKVVDYLKQRLAEI
ncbi:MAG: bifunctional phosphoglucose/phosphomannose isomerase [Anaerolineales bacterium]|nr:MAG: bifunctional phosphoglucose/phosphomannose isomerase [Anaerolineales bacterium]